jgi:hypothetical protein
MQMAALAHSVMRSAYLVLRRQPAGQLGRQRRLWRSSKSAAGGQHAKIRDNQPLLLTGSLPASWGANGGFGALQNLLLESNMLDGDLPVEWGSQGRFGGLARLDVSGNDLQGSIPASWGANGNLPSLTGL